MKKLFTLFALLACFLGAKAEVEKVYEVDYSKYTAFPWWVMEYVPEWIDGVMTDFGGNYKYLEVKEDATETSDVIVKNAGGTEYYKITKAEGSGTWHQYFIADGIPTELDGAYTVKAMVKASEAVTINVNMGWGWGEGQSIGASVSIPQSDEFVEVEWEYTGIGGSSCNLVAQPNTAATIEWKSLEVYTDKGDAVPVTWLQMLTNDGKALDEEGHTNIYVGDAEFGAWPAWALETTDGINANWRTDRAGEICAWSLTMGRNFDDQCAEFGQPADRARPYPSDIEAEAGNESNHVFAVHVEQIDKIDDDNSIAWSNQFWIQSPQAWKSGLKAKVSFRYKAQHACNVDTQTHKYNPSVYDGGSPFGTLGFTTEWQEVTKEVELSGSAASIAFNLTSDATNGRTPNVFYFDNLSWEMMKLEEGLFVAAKGNDYAYDYAQATQFVEEEKNFWVATVGTKGKQETWATEVQISTVRGDKSAFIGATLKPTGTITLDAEGMSDWLGYTESSQAKIKLPAAGVYKIYIDTETNEMQFEKIEGEAAQEPVDIVTNATECVVHGAEREDLKDGFDNGVITVKEEADDPEGQTVGGEGHEGQPWDNQFWIAANRELSTGEVTVIKFKYKATTAARTSTQAHKMGEDGKPCTYLNWQAIGDVNFTEEWQDYEKEFTVPEGDNGMMSIVFNLAEVKYADDYYFKDFQWYVKDAALEADGKTMENLIKATGAENFWIKENKGNPESAATGISTVVAGNKKASNITYNLAGQRVSNDYKGIVVKNGKKVVNK